MKETRAIILPPNESCNGDGWSRQSHERTFRGAARLATHRFTSVMLCGSKRRALRLPRKRLAGGTAKIRVGRAPLVADRFAAPSAGDTSGQPSKSPLN